MYVSSTAVSSRLRAVVCNPHTGLETAIRQTSNYGIIEAPVVVLVFLEDGPGNVIRSLKLFACHRIFLPDDHYLLGHAHNFCMRLTCSSIALGAPVASGAITR